MRIFASKKFLIIAGMILALFIGIVIGSSSNPSKMLPNRNLAANIVNETVLENGNGGDNLTQASAISNGGKSCSRY